MAKLTQKKQWSKWLSTNIAVNLIEANRGSLLEKSYRNTIYCSDVLKLNDESKLVTTYCKNRWCVSCGRIRTAQLINGYLPQLKGLFNPVFVTLTLPTCSERYLPARVKEMQKAWRTIYKRSMRVKYKKNHTKLQGVRKAECTLRPDGKYHYHYHIIMNGWAEAEWLVGAWLKYFPEANRKAQDVRIANEYSFKELFKYFTKLTSKTNSKINYRRLDVVFRALRGKRTYQAFGGIRQQEEEDFDPLTAELDLEGLEDKIFKWVDEDWFGKSTGVALINKPIPERVKKIIQKGKNNSIKFSEACKISGC